MSEVKSGAESAAKAVEALAGESASDPVATGVGDVVQPVPDTAEGLEDAIEDAIEDGASVEEVKDMIREYELKVNGKSKKVKIDLNDEKDLIRRLQMAEAGQSAMQEKAELEKMVTQELLRWQKDPDVLFSELGLDPDDWAERRITKKVEELQKTPEQLEREAMIKELEQARMKLKQQEEAVKETKMQQLQQQASAQLEQEIMDALDKNPNLPRTRKTIIRIADALSWAIDNVSEDVRVSDVVPAVEEEIRAEFNEFISELPDEVMESYLGKKNLERLRKKRLAAMKKAPSVENVKQTSATAPKERNRLKEPGSIRARDYFRDLK